MDILKAILDKDELSKDDIVYLLKLSDPQLLDQLYNKADKVRFDNVGDNVHLRGIIELSNYCGRQCIYCGLRSENTVLERYRIEPEEILEIAKKAKALDYKTLVLQSGEDSYYTIEIIEEIIRSIKANMDMYITLSLGERPDEEYVRMRNAGADRYLIKHETSDRELYKKLHPDMEFENRVSSLKFLKSLGFEVGSGIMVGIPGQSIESIASDILFFQELNLDMVGLGPYIPNPETPLYKEYSEHGYFLPELDYDLEEMTYKIIAITRLVNKTANIPATTALATTNPAYGRETALKRGANVVMPNVTSQKYRKLYEIYPAKVCVDEKPEDCRVCINKRITSINRVPV